MTHRLFIDGGAGTTGLEIRDRLAGRPDFELITLDETERKTPAARRDALNAADFVILCLPDDAAREAVSLIDNETTRVIDASSAHRVADGWIYGFPELEPTQQTAIAAARRVSNPGCYPSGFLALVRPLVRAGLIPPEWPLTVNAISGYSGGGKAMIAEFEAQGGGAAYRGYALTLAHKHVPEMQRHARLDHPPIFTPAVVRIYRGMVVDVPLPLYALNRDVTLEAIEACLHEAYDRSQLVHVARRDDGRVDIASDAGSDRMTLSVHGNADAKQARLVATLDNLGKGAAGAAVQNLNIMAGIDPIAGLTL